MGLGKKNDLNSSIRNFDKSTLKKNKNTNDVYNGLDISSLKSSKKNKKADTKEADTQRSNSIDDNFTSYLLAESLMEILSVGLD